MISLKAILKTYQTEDIETLALSDINLTVSAGEFVGIMGPSGCGKSTLLSVLGLIEPPTGGTTVEHEATFRCQNQPDHEQQAGQFHAG